MTCPAILGLWGLSLWMEPSQTPLSLLTNTLHALTMYLHAQFYRFFDRGMCCVDFQPNTPDQYQRAFIAYVQVAVLIRSNCARIWCFEFCLQIRFFVAAASGGHCWIRGRGDADEGGLSLRMLCAIMMIDSKYLENRVEIRRTRLARFYRARLAPWWRFEMGDRDTVAVAGAEKALKVQMWTRTKIGECGWKQGIYKIMSRWPGFATFAGTL